VGIDIDIADAPRANDCAAEAKKWKGVVDGVARLDAAATIVSHKHPVPEAQPTA
jgi:hypothetical protein